MINFIIGLAVGIILAYLYHNKITAALTKEKALLEQKVADLLKSKL